MNLNQLNPDLNDAFETYFRDLRGVRAQLHRFVTAGLAFGLRERTRLFGGVRLTNERIVEYPQILQWLPPTGRVLDIGCASSRLAVQLASLGYDVHAVDQTPYSLEHPGVTFHQADFMTWTPPCTFDAVTLVSAIEHFGIGAYGDVLRENADVDAVRKVAGMLAPGGHLLVSVPYGASTVTRKHRVYDRSGLRNLFSTYTVVDERYFRRRDGHWFPSTPEELAAVASPDLPVNGAAVLKLSPHAGAR